MFGSGKNRKRYGIGTGASVIVLTYQRPSYGFQRPTVIVGGVTLSVPALLSRKQVLAALGGVHAMTLWRLCRFAGFLQPVRRGYFDRREVVAWVRRACAITLRVERKAARRRLPTAQRARRGSAPNNTGTDSQVDALACHRDPRVAHPREWISFGVARLAKGG